MMKMLRWLCFSPRTSRRIEDSNLSDHEQGLSDLGYVVEEIDTMPVVYNTIADYKFGPTANRESSLWGFVAKIAALLTDDAVNRVALWGLEGSGKTVIARTLNDKIHEGSFGLQFDLVIWVAKELDLRRRLIQIAERLGLTFSEEEEPEAVISRRIFLKLQSFKTCLIIIDDVHKSIDLDLLGFPWRNEGNGRLRMKILITTRDQAVCRRLAVDHIVKLDFLSFDDSWKYFCTQVGEEATSIPIEPIAKQVCKELGGYQFAIKAVEGRREKSISQWKYVLRQLKFPGRVGMSTTGMVYASLKSSYYDCLQDKMKSCFLLCASYPGSCIISVKEVVCHMVAKGIIQQGCHQEEEGLMLVQGLKDICLLEDGPVDETVTMHAVIRGFVRWLMATNEGKVNNCSPQTIEQQVILASLS